jgi:hypothetical protein
MTRLLIIVLLTFTFASCRKNKALFDGQSCTGSCYVLTGRLSEFQNSSALANTQLDFYYKTSGGIFNNHLEYLGKTITAADGSYTFKFDSKDYKNPTGYFSMEGTRDGYIYNNYGDKTEKNLLIFQLDSSKINIPQVNNVALYKVATLKIIVKAVTITNFGYLTIGYNYGRGNFGPVLYGGRSIDTTLIYKTAGDIPTFINWNARGNGVDINRNDTLIVPSGTEKIYQINL